jgi:hypothetical protein
MHTPALKKINTTKRGFSLFETLVAIFILMLAVAGAMSLTQKSLSSAYYSRDQVIASFLAQDAIEYIRSIRDYNYNYSNDPNNAVRGWMTSLTACFTSTCVVDTKVAYNAGVNAQSGMQSCVSIDTCPQLQFNPADSSYGQDQNVGESSRFKREVTLCYIQDNGSNNCTLASDEVSVKVTVTWKTGAFQPQSIVVRENLRNWGKIDP